jgi:hypothetical protein
MTLDIDISLLQYSPVHVLHVWIGASLEQNSQNLEKKRTSLVKLRRREAILPPLPLRGCELAHMSMAGHTHN